MAKLSQTRASSSARLTTNGRLSLLTYWQKECESGVCLAFFQVPSRPISLLKYCRSRSSSTNETKATGTFRYRATRRVNLSNSSSGRDLAELWREGRFVSMALDPEFVRANANGCCQTDSNRSRQGQYDCPLCRAETAPLCQSGGAVRLEDGSTGEAALAVEVVGDGGVDGR